MGRGGAGDGDVACDGDWGLWWVVEGGGVWWWVVEGGGGWWVVVGSCGWGVPKAAADEASG